MTIPRKYKKKPVIVEALLWDGKVATFDDIIAAWPDIKLYGDVVVRNATVLREGDALYIQTLEGPMRCDVGNMVIRGVRGEYYSCDPGIFEETYTPC